MMVGLTTNDLRGKNKERAELEEKRRVNSGELRYNAINAGKLHTHAGSPNSLSMKSSNPRTNGHKRESEILTFFLATRMIDGTESCLRSLPASHMDTLYRFSLGFCEQIT